MEEAVVGSVIRPPRIVHADDEPLMLELVEAVLRGTLPAMTLLGFETWNAAWLALQGMEPDLLITDMNNSGWELLPRLVDRKASYPVLIVSGSFLMSGEEAKARHVAGRALNASFLTKPFAPDFFRQEVVRLLKSEPSCGRRIPNGDSR